ncbi:hypothetical protein ONZ45_g7008 [Pleurotus djamor]|nr:hypothetical protein ONZ45_g7008 [Pleurotus djamor]
MPKVLPSSKPQSLPYMRFRNNRALAILQKDAVRDHSYDASPLPDPEVYHAALNLETKSYDEARRMIAFAFDLLGFERSFGDDESDVQKYQWSNGGTYPPHLDIIPHDELLKPKQIFDHQRLMQTVGIITKINVISKCIFAPGPTVKTMADIEAFNRARHSGSQLLPKPITTMYSEPNIGLLPDWYTDAVFAQQFFTGPNPCTITAALPLWLKRFTDAAKAQGNDDIVKLLTSSPVDSFYTLDYSHFRDLMGAPRDESFSNTANDVTKYGCAAVTLFVLPPTGTLHPLAIIPDYKGSMDASVTIFNKRLDPSNTSIDQASDWPWRYAKTCVQVSDFAYHEVIVHLNNTHLVEEAIIVAGNRALPPGHIILRLLKPHWQVTLSLNALARTSLVPNVILPITGYKSEYVYTLLKNAFAAFNWEGSYVPHDLEARGFPLDKLDDPKFHNYPYARNMSEMWKTIRKFVSSVLRNDAYYRDDASVAADSGVQDFAREMSSADGAGMVKFPKEIKTLDQLIDVVTMCIHIAAPQHTAVNYLQQFYQTFPPNKSSALYAPMPTTLDALNAVDEEFLVESLPVRANQDWLLMCQVPYLLSMPVDTAGNIVTYAKEAIGDGDVVIAAAGKQFFEDLKGLEVVFQRNSAQLDNQQIPYDVMNPEQMATAIVI